MAADLTNASFLRSFALATIQDSGLRTQDAMRRDTLENERLQKEFEEGWQTCLDEMCKHDLRMMRDWNEEIDALLLFVSLLARTCLFRLHQYIVLMEDTGSAFLCGCHNLRRRLLQESSVRPSRRFCTTSRTDFAAIVKPVCGPRIHQLDATCRSARPHIQSFGIFYTDQSPVVYKSCLQPDNRAFCHIRAPMATAVRRLGSTVCQAKRPSPAVTLRRSTEMGHRAHYDSATAVTPDIPRPVFRWSSGAFMDPP